VLNPLPNFPYNFNSRRYIKAGKAKKKVTFYIARAEQASVAMRYLVGRCRLKPVFAATE
jgi:hypothetical protein